MLPDLRTLARALGGEVVGRQVLSPGPGHGRNDRSLSIKLNASSPFGFLAHSFAGDDFTDCRDYVVERLGLDPDGWKTKERQHVTADESRILHRAILASSEVVDEGEMVDQDRAAKTAEAVIMWAHAIDPQYTSAEKYLNSRSLKLTDDLCNDVLRWRPFEGAMIALFRNIQTGAPQAVTRIYLDRDNRKTNRKFLGPVGGAAVMLDAFDEVTTGLHICEGVETGMAARQMGLKPTWALGSAGAIASFPVLNGIECLTILTERDDAGRRATFACATRWRDAGRQVIIAEPVGEAKDFNDALKASK